MINPAKLPPDRRDSICSQCHLSGDVRVMRPGANWQSFRPGDRLSDSVTVFVRSGGSIPIVGDFANHLGIPTILMGFGLPDDGLHSPNEKYKIENYYLGIRTVARFLEEYGA